MVVKKIVNKMM